MVTKPDSTAHTLWLDIEALFHENKEAQIMEFENELRQITMGDKSINELYERMKVTLVTTESISSLSTTRRELEK